jgi:hypothetical protein
MVSASQYMADHARVTIYVSTYTQRASIETEQVLLGRSQHMIYLYKTFRLVAISYRKEDENPDVYEQALKDGTSRNTKHREE